ncbi:MAG: AtpZ/AtpI family protein [Phycisphaerales bacterium]
MAGTKQPGGEPVEPTEPTGGGEAEGGEWRPPMPPSADDPRLAIPPELRKSFRTEKEGGRGAPSATSTVAEMGKAWGTAMEFVFTIIGCGVLGYFFDRWQATGSSAGVMVGLAAGFAFALYKIIRTTQKQEAMEKAQRERR